MSNEASMLGMAAEALAAPDAGRRIAPFSARHPAFGLDDGYRVAADRTQDRFTNRAMWAAHGVHAPIWGFVSDRTIHDIG